MPTGKSPPFIITSADVPEKSHNYPNSDEPLAPARAIGRAAGLLKIGLHLQRIPPGHRISWPHAEEKEEEFVYVLEGEVQAWIDGTLYPMKRGDLAAFPAGTGICHTFINNGHEDATLLVGGEASKADNRIFYPLHPHREADMPWSHWWSDMPQKPQGAHDGKPDALRKQERSKRKVSTPRAGDFDYDTHGSGYALQRRTDSRIEAHVHAALGAARRVLNVGAGAGSYEPTDKHVIAIEPSAAMRAQRPSHRAPAICGIAEALPLDDQSVDASMATITLHQWADFRKGLAEMRRVTRGPIVLLTFDGAALDRFWLTHYAPEVIAVERRRFPSIESICAAVGGTSSVKEIAIPVDCVDGFGEAYYARPEQLLDPVVRRSQSAWGFVTDEVQNRFIKQLDDDLRTGKWDERYGELRRRPFFEGSLRLIVALPTG